MSYAALKLLSGFSFSESLLTAELQLHSVAYLEENTIDIAQSHPYHEIVLVLRGDLTVEVNGEIFQVRQGELLHIGPQITRRLKIYPHIPLSLLLISFSICDGSPRRGDIKPEWIEEERTLLALLNKSGCHIQPYGTVLLEQVNRLCRFLEENRTGVASLLPNMLSALVLNCLQDLGQLQSRPSVALQGSTVLANKITALNEYIQLHYAEPITIEQAAKALNYSSRHLQRLISEYHSVSFSDYLLQFRVGRAKSLLGLTTESVDRIAEQCGFRSLRVFERNFRRLVGMTPTAFRNKYSVINPMDSDN